MTSPKALAPKSEPTDKDKNKQPRAIRVRAQDGPWRGGWFRFYLPIDETILPLGSVNYLLVQDADPLKWGLREQSVPSI